MRANSLRVRLFLSAAFLTVVILIATGAYLSAQYRAAVDYVDRILDGEPAGMLPVQAPTRFELVINGATAKALGLTVPPALHLRADKLI